MIKEKDYNQFLTTDGLQILCDMGIDIEDITENFECMIEAVVGEKLELEFLQS